MHKDVVVKHGMYKSVEYRAWVSMLQRSTAIGRFFSARYALRGIGVCERWKVFDNFFADMGLRPPGHTLDRINNDLGYSPQNCRWATPKQQGRNRSDNVILAAHGISACIAWWAEATGIPWATIKARMVAGLPPEQIIPCGYLRPTEQWNDGKQEEFRDRRSFVAPYDAD